MRKQDWMQDPQDTPTPEWWYERTTIAKLDLAIRVYPDGKAEIKHWEHQPGYPVRKWVTLYTLDSVEEAKKLYTMLAALEGV